MTKKRQDKKSINWKKIGVIASGIVGALILIDLALSLIVNANILLTSRFSTVGIIVLIIVFMAYFFLPRSLKTNKFISRIPVFVTAAILVLSIPLILGIAKTSRDVLGCQAEDIYARYLNPACSGQTIKTQIVPTDQFPSSTQLSQVISPELILTPSVQTQDIDLVKATIMAEVKGVEDKDLLILEAIFAANAEVINHMKTPQDASDDKDFKGWDNIKQQHYVVLFSSNGWNSPYYLVNLQIKVIGNHATGIHEGIVSGGKYYPDYSIYYLEKANEKWVITKLEFGNK